MSVIAAVLGAALWAVVPPAKPAMAAPLSFRFDGGAWGHGLGMGQWGAKGQADAGRSPTQILTSYFQGTTVGPTNVRPSIRVGLLQNVSKMTIRSAGAAPGSGGDGHFAFGWANGGHRDAFAGETWEVRAEGAGWGLYRNGSKTDGFSGMLHVDFNFFGSMVSVAETGHRYRWGFFDLVHRAGSATFDAVAHIPSYDQYLYGLGEMPSSWGNAALQAQAIAGRTYALEKGIRLGDFRSGCACTVFASTLDQAYVGYDKEGEGGGFGAKWVAAVNATSGQAVLNGGAPIQALYSSSTGGHTEHNEFVYGGSALSYLRGVPDPWDNTPGNPNHKWSVSYTVDDLSNRLNANSSTAVGTVTDITLLPPFGVSGRVGRVIDDGRGGARITGTNGTKRVSGSTLQSVLGLKSTLFGVSRTIAHPDGAIVKSPSSPAVWIIQGGARYPVYSDSAYQSRASYSEIATIPDAVLGTYPVGGAGHRDGALLRTPDGRVYLVSDAVRRWITSETVFNGLHFSWDNVRSVGNYEASVLFVGQNVSSSSTLPNGVFARTAASPQVYLMVGGQARPVPSESVFRSYRASFAEVVTASATQIGVPSAPIGFRDGSLIRTSNARVYAIANQEKRYIVSQAALNNLGYPPGAITSATDSEAAAHANGPDIAGGPHPDGAIVKASNGPTIWIVRDGIRHPVVSAAALESRASFGEVATVSAGALAPLPVLSAGWRNGSLLRTPDGRIYVVSDGRRRWITSEAVFNGLGLSGASVRNVGFTDAAVHPPGADVTAPTPLPNGMFVKQSNSPTIYRIDGGQARPVVSMSALQTWRLGGSEVATVGDIPNTGPAAGFRSGTLIKTGDGKIWAIAGDSRRWITSESAFVALGYEYADVINALSVEANVHPEGENIG